MVALSNDGTYDTWLNARHWDGIPKKAAEGLVRLSKTLKPTELNGLHGVKNGNHSTLLIHPLWGQKSERLRNIKDSAKLTFGGEVTFCTTFDALRRPGWVAVNILKV